MRTPALLLATAVALLPATPLIAATYVYGFESATAGTFATDERESLTDNDGWTLRDSTGTNLVIDSSLDSPVVGFSGNYAYAIAGDTQYSRANDPDFSYSLNDTELITASFLLRGRNAGNQMFALGVDADATTGLNASNEVGFQFGISGDNWAVRQASFGTQSTSAHGLGTNGNDTYEVRLLIDPTANSGNGSGNFSFRNITTSGSWTDVGSLQNVNLGLNSMADSSPSSWDSLYVRIGRGGGGGARIDTLTLSQVPEPQTLLLGLLAVGGLCLRRRRS